MDFELEINGKNAKTEFGITMDSEALSALMTPAPNKEFIRSKSRLLHGAKVIRKDPKKDERDITLTFNLSARSEDEFFTRYARFCSELETGVLNIRTKYQPTTVYRCTYISCSQFTQFMRGLAKFVLRLNEPNPDNRGLTE